MLAPEQPLDWSDTAAYAGLLAARMLPVVTFTPIFGGESVPHRLRLGLLVLVALPLLVHADVQAVATVHGVDYALLVMKEALLGSTIALATLIVFEALAAAGAFVDLARGQSTASVLDPQSHQSHSPLAVLMRQATLVLFLSSGGYGVVCDALRESLVALPPTAIPDETSLRFGPAGVALGALPSIFTVALQLALPAFAVSILIDLGFGLLGRAAPSVQSYALAMPVRALLVFGIFVLSLHGAVVAAGAGLDSLLSQVRNAFAW